MDLKMNDGDDELPRMAEVKSISSLLSHILCCVTAVLVLRPSEKLTRVGQHGIQGCFVGSKKRLQASLGLLGAERRLSTGRGRDRMRQRVERHDV